MKKKQKAPEFFDRVKQTFETILTSPCNPVPWDEYKKRQFNLLDTMDTFVKQAKLADVSVELVEPSGYGDDPYCELQISGIRAWSETQIRKHKEKLATEILKTKQETEDKEHEEYLRLHKKYGDKPGVRQRS